MNLNFCKNQYVTIFCSLMEAYTLEKFIKYINQVYSSSVNFRTMLSTPLHITKLSVLEFWEISHHSEALQKTTMPGIIILNILRIYSYAPHHHDYNGTSMSSVLSKLSVLEFWAAAIASVVIISCFIVSFNFKCCSSFQMRFKVLSHYRVLL